MAPIAMKIAALASLAACVQAEGGGFLRAGRFEAENLEDEVRKIDEYLKLSNFAPIQQIEDQLKQMFASLPRNENGKLDHDTVRYALHRYFAHRYGWHFYGLKPDNGIASEAQDKRAWAINSFQGLFEQLETSGGADLHHLAALAFGIQDLVKEEDTQRLDVAYGLHGLKERSDLIESQANIVLETWYMGLLNSGVFPDSGPVETEAFRKRFANKYGRWEVSKGWFDERWAKFEHPVNGVVTFQELASRAHTITEAYVDFNEYDCQEIRSAMQDIAVNSAPGRVRLSSFYLAGQHSHFDFNENYGYLRSIGAIDDSDEKYPSVIIVNYAMSQSNCMEASNLYSICCQNGCEGLMRDLEAQVGGEDAEPAQLEKLVLALSTPTQPARTSLDSVASQRLAEIAQINDGKIPLQGRLFAQWMHHAFPMECPYPHERGTLAKHDDSDTAASQEEIQSRVDDDTCSVDDHGKVDCGEATAAELPWSSKEELLSARSSKQEAGTRSNALLFLAMGMMLATLVFAMSPTKGGKGKAQVQWKTVAGLFGLCFVAYAVGLLDQDIIFCLAVFSIFLVGIQEVSRGKIGVKEGLLPTLQKDAKCFV